MSKNKKILIGGLVAVAVIAGVGVGVWLQFGNNKEVSVATATEVAGAMALNPQQNTSDTISLSPKSATQKDPNALSVNDGQSRSANLGSGSRQQSSQTTTGNNAPSQENFGQYEQYKEKTEVYFGDMVVGNGPEAVKDKQLAVTYKGYLTNGQVFDQSRATNNGQLQPLLFTLGSGQLIPGFEQGVVGMKVGGTRRIIIPPSLGYGANAQGGIPANSVLVFDVTLTAAQ